MKRLVLVFIGTLLLSGCASSAQSNSEYSADDISFAEMMIPHHEQAIEMSEIALLNTTNPGVLQLAQEIKDAQSPEIAHKIPHTALQDFTNIYKVSNSALRAAIHESI